MDIVKFCEKVLNIQLLDFQKKLLRDMCAAVKNNQQFIIMPRPDYFWTDSKDAENYLTAVGSKKLAIMTK